MTAHPTFSLARWSRQTNAMGTLRFFAMWVDTFWGRSLRSSWNDKVPSMSVPTPPSLEESGPFWNYKDTVQIKNQFHVLSTQQKCMKTTACLFIKSIFKLFAVQSPPPIISSLPCLCGYFLGSCCLCFLHWFTGWSVFTCLFGFSGQ